MTLGATYVLDTAKAKELASQAQQKQSEAQRLQAQTEELQAMLLAANEAEDPPTNINNNEPPELDTDHPQDDPE